MWKNIYSATSLILKENDTKTPFCTASPSKVMKFKKKKKNLTFISNSSFWKPYFINFDQVKVSEYSERYLR